VISQIKSVVTNTVCCVVPDVLGWSHCHWFGFCAFCYHLFIRDWSDNGAFYHSLDQFWTPQQNDAFNPMPRIQKPQMNTSKQCIQQRWQYLDTWLWAKL